jgi:hypothetical protein
MTIYYRLMGWGEYRTDQPWDYQPYPEEWVQEQERAGLTNSMASEVKRQRISGEESFSLPSRYNWNVDPHARLLRREVLFVCQPPGCTKQLFRVNVARPFASVPRRRALRSAPQKLLRAPCRPFKATRSRCCQRPQFRLGSARGQPRGVMLHVQLHVE